MTTGIATIAQLGLTTTPQKIIPNRNASAIGIRFYNPSVSSIYVKEVQKGVTADIPTSTTMVTNGQISCMPIPPGSSYQSDAGPGIDVYACVASGTATISPEDVLGA